MSDQDDPRESVYSILDTANKRRRSLHELERREAQDDILHAPLARRVQIDELREQLAANQARLGEMLPRLPQSLQQRVQTTRIRWAREDITHLQGLAALRQRKCDELERREASYGPGEAPISLLNSLAAEREALADLNRQLALASEAWEDEERRGHGPGERDQLTVIISTVDGKLYEAQVPASLLVAQLKATFLDWWHPTRDSREERYVLRREPDSGTLPADFSLVEAGVKTHDTLYLAREVTLPSARVWLIVENPVGERFVAEVPYDSSIGHLAREFFTVQGWIWHQSHDHQPWAAVELLSADDSGASRRLENNLTLLDTNLQDGDTLRIYPQTTISPLQEGDTV